MKKHDVTSHEASGVALVIVLAMLVLITALVVAFFSSVTTDYASAKSYSNGENAKQLADSAVNVVMAQIKDATAGFEINSSTGLPDPTQPRLVWASQPGMVRTWDDSGASYKEFKLYSSGTMVVTGSYNPGSDSEFNEISGTTWKARPSIYTDLNSPVLIRDDTNGTIVPDTARPGEKYIAVAPIIDPNNLTLASGSLTYGPSATPYVEGFSAVNPSTYDGNPNKISPSNNPVPMPVRWLYVLKDGEITAPTFSNNNAVFNAPGQPVPTSINPIVGRIAFWADDETCKVNINTASEGVFWDVPVCASLDEMPLAANPPVQGEFQRVPGHPAMTCLSSLFANRLPVDHTINPTLSSAARDAFQNSLQTICNLTPRIMPGSGIQGSKGGTAPIWNRSYAYGPAVGNLNPNLFGSGAQDLVIPTAISTGTARLFASVDEFIARVPGISDTVRPMITGSTGILPSEVRRASFFATASSRAPEVNLFNGPRISLWPITWPYQSAQFHDITYATSTGTANGIMGRLPVTNGDPTKPLATLENVSVRAGGTRTVTKWIEPQEKLLAFCAQIGASGTNGIRYFFQRQNPDSPVYDYNNIQRNQDLLGNYLRNLTGSAIPGFGGSFAGKYGVAGRDFILVSLFDAIRGTVNLVTTTGTAADVVSSIDYDYAGMNLRVSGTGGLANSGDVPTSQVTPIRIDLGSGVKKSCGQFPTIPEVVLVFMATQRNDPWPVYSGSNGWLASSGSAGWPLASGSASTTGSFNSSYLISGTNPQTTQMRMIVLLSTFSPSTIAVMPSYWVKATGASFQVNGTPVNFPVSGGNKVEMTSINNLQAPGFGFGYYYGINGSYVKDLIVGGTAADAYRHWEFVSDPISIDPTQGTMFNFTGSTVTFQIYAPNSLNANADPTGTPGNLVQTIQIDFSKLNGAAAVPLAPRWTENQIIPVEAKNAGVPASSAVSVSGTPSTTLFYSGSGATANSREISMKGWYLYQDQAFDKVRYPDFTSGTTTYTGVTNTNLYISTDWTDRMVLANNRTGTNGLFYCKSNPTVNSTLPASLLPKYFPGTQSCQLIISPYDTALSMAPDPQGPAKGDGRVIAGLASVTPDYYAPAWTSASRNFDGMDDNNTPGGTTKYPRTTMGWQRHTLGRYGRDGNPIGPLSGVHIGSGAPYTLSTDKITLLNAQMASSGYTSAVGTLGKPGSGSELGVVAFGLTQATNTGVLGDWTNNAGNRVDGCAIFFPDQYYQTFGSDAASQTSVTAPAWIPYFVGSIDTRAIADYFSPNRQVSSGVTLFGTLPSPALGSSDGKPQPWQTLLFCPNPAIGSGHPGFGVLGSRPADHLLLDLFWMPVVEPYAISEPLATAGKINLNYAIVPFTNIKRQTGLYAAMKSLKMTAIPSTSAAMLADYKSFYQMSVVHPTVNTRYNIDTADTLKAFDAKFAGGDLFRSASQICEMFLYPADPATGAALVSYDSSASNIKTWWTNQQLTGDNSREIPYGHIYPRVTTKSNTYQVHYRVQLLKKRTNSDQTTWVEGRDQVVSEYRGSSILERYIDPNDPRLPDFATLSLSSTNAVIDKYYRFRVVNTKVFTP